jgi:hypothetical protein
MYIINFRLCEPRRLAQGENAERANTEAVEVVPVVQELRKSKFSKP